MNIKKAAELSGIKTDNIRYYERIGLIPKITRTESGIRNFTEANIRTLKFVKHMRDAGVQVEPLTRYMALVNEGNPETKEERIEILKNQVEQLRTEIIEKQSALDYLTFKIENYDEVMLPSEINLDQSSKETVKI
ncbi:MULTISPECIES: MerR family transcriptional regulator [Lactococcus]|jgi:DNA-binding transcriptional MerR regulator|uniref:MerR family transcriptional regulator n=1 Tax=Lactococcus lactis subsp. lactis TaxID=1360 RepID=A0A2Z3KQ68_LACLL|nr:MULTISPECIES: MerR family transcriptional regulator [Lactococcus]AWN66473.1 MerR family transcriptional regulator [Lactococcus lactis subsp. lactis]MBK0029429.1 MerR family transcriptional regulator [Lactococcus sp. S47]MDR1823558.1 MerR family transcriptional regulator [Lactococcus lactis]QNL92248.1 MerR family transcriptional regulator [Lactococcus lactis]WFB95266.1 MerR family transcriptional regulator [Lactococcus lactis]